MYKILSHKIRRHGLSESGVPPSSVVVFSRTALQNYLTKFWSEKNGAEDSNKIDWIQKTYWSSKCRGNQLIKFDIKIWWFPLNLMNANSVQTISTFITSGSFISEWFCWRWFFINISFWSCISIANYWNLSPCLLEPTPLTLHKLLQPLLHMLGGWNLA